MSFIQYYLIHNLEEEREKHMSMMFEKYGIKKKDVKYINHPNKNELTYKIKNRIICWL